MKKIALIIAAGLLFGGAAFAKEENGALGFGIVSDSSEKGLVGGGIRGALFLDVGYQLAGPVFYGFEFQGALKKMDEAKSSLRQTDVSAYQLSDTDWVLFVQSTNWDFTVTRWDADFSPRGYLSFDLGDKIQLLGFAGLNYNWTTVDTTVKDKRTGAGLSIQGPSGWGQFTPSQEKTESKALDGVWDAVAGFRVSVGAFYVDYMRFLAADTAGNYSWNKSNKNRLGLGINLRF